MRKVIIVRKMSYNDKIMGNKNSNSSKSESKSKLTFDQNTFLIDFLMRIVKHNVRKEPTFLYTNIRGLLLLSNRNKPSIIKNQLDLYNGIGISITELLLNSPNRGIESIQC